MTVRQSSLAGLIRSALLPVPCTSWQLKQVTPRVYIRLCTKSLPCIRFLCAVPSAKCVNVVSPSLCSSSFQKSFRLRALLKPDRPVVVLAFDRIRQRLPLRMALDAGVVGADEVELRRIDDVRCASDCRTCSLPGPWHRSQPTFHSVTVFVWML